MLLWDLGAKSRLKISRANKTHAQLLSEDSKQTIQNLKRIKEYCLESYNFFGGGTVQ